MTLSMNIHEVEGIDLGKIEELSSSKYRNIKINSKNGESFEITLFADEKESLEVGITKTEKV